MENTHNHYPHNHHDHTHDPCDGFCPSQSQLCFFEHIKPSIQEMIDQSLPDMSVLNALVEGIDDYECNTDKLYDCKEIILFKGGFFESLKNDNNRHPHDDNAWKQHGSLTDIFATLSRLQEAAVLAIPYHNTCDMSPVCVPFYNEGDCAAIRVETDQIDSCGNKVYKTEYYKSQEDKNSDTPAPDVDSWDGPYHVCDVFNGVFTPTPPPVNEPTLHKVCLKRNADQVNQIGFLQVTDGDLLNAIWLLPDGSVVDSTTHSIDPDCVC